MDEGSRSAKRLVALPSHAAGRSAAVGPETSNTIRPMLRAAESPTLLLGIHSVGDVKTSPHTRATFRLIFKAMTRLSNASLPK